MADDMDEKRSTTKTGESEGPLAWLSKRAGLVVLVVIAAIVALRLMSSWLKWLLIAMVVGAVYYLITSRPDDESSQG
ncbi:hypothetical protein ENSA5_52410 [Enhygromyxa salina]|uniref:Uncharacterized protein n=1 Tax=Enhygromyxa salina TaxID=215803 RepID=A0A2S9XG02_9BACT|nr:hypothetical protein [Enhygromyxa salina]PRP91804.1 hypothetical protein ENSA5_52410 [Enhygromyxa salina]